MIKWRSSVVVVFLTVSIHSIAQEIKLIKKTHLAHYPSASSLEYHNGYLYVIGDDAAQMLVLDNNHRTADSLVLFAGKTTRLSKNKKADLESSVVLTKEGRDYLVAFPSFSTPRRDKIMVIDLASKETRIISMPRMRVAGIRDLNIEGSAIVKDRLLLSTRANIAQPHNYLLVSKIDLVSGFGEKELKSILLQLPQQKEVVGISSLSYLESEDLLLFTATTEATSNSFADGVIGDSYLGYIKNISGRLHYDQIMADQLINISPIINNGAQKIESVVVEAQKGKELIIHLASDNDDGASTLFKMSWMMR